MSITQQAAKERVNSFLVNYLATQQESPLLTAVEYSLLNVGKRVRPYLVYAIGELFNVPLEELDYIAGALECIHVYSLIHDDLPCMDDDDYRHDKLAAHKKFPEALAVLAGDTLQSLAFELITAANLPPLNKINIIKTLAQKIGLSGMCLGQALELTNQTSTAASILNIHYYKTACLLQAATLSGYQASTATDSATYQLIQEFAENIGVAFQLQDDLFDAESNEASSMVYFLPQEEIQALIDQKYTRAYTLLEQLAPLDTTALQQFTKNLHTRTN